MTRHRRACRTGKRPYHDQGEAKEALKRIRQSGERRDSTPMRSYLCEFCHRWHLTSQEDHSVSTEPNWHHKAS